MSLIKKSDVKNHLSTRTGSTSVFPFGLTRPDAGPAQESKVSGAKRDTADISISPSHPISPEAVPNAEVGGSVGIPANAASSEKRSWLGRRRSFFASDPSCHPAFI
jgi:hypothetical protein